MSKNTSLPSAPLIGRGHLSVRGIGHLWLMWSGIGLVKIAWAEPDLVADVVTGKREFLPPLVRVPEPYSTLLGGYFMGYTADPAELAVDLRGTPFQRKVWRALRKIPRGAVSSYGEIACKIGHSSASRAVGSACRINRLPIVVPCHRVVSAAMALGGYSGGLRRKTRLLELEGLRVARGRVELR